jgi:hypothetical protein
VVVAENFYWRGRNEAAHRALNDLKSVTLGTSATTKADGGEEVVTVRMTNSSAVPALNAKLTLVDAAGKRVLPAFYSDNYVALLPGEERTIEVRYPASHAPRATSLTLRGWNVAAGEVPVR